MWVWIRPLNVGMMQLCRLAMEFECFSLFYCLQEKIHWLLLRLNSFGTKCCCHKSSSECTVNTMSKSKVEESERRGTHLPHYHNKGNCVNAFLKKRALISVKLPWINKGVGKHRGKKAGHVLNPLPGQNIPILCSLILKMHLFSSFWSSIYTKPDFFPTPKWCILIMLSRVVESKKTVLSKMLAQTQLGPMQQ